MVNNCRAEAIGGKSSDQLPSLLPCDRKERNGPLMNSMPPTNSTRCEGLTNASTPASKPKISCQKRSKTPPTPKISTPAKESRYSFGKRLHQAVAAADVAILHDDVEQAVGRYPGVHQEVEGREEGLIHKAVIVGIDVDHRAQKAPDPQKQRNPGKGRCQFRIPFPARCLCRFSCRTESFPYSHLNPPTLLSNPVCVFPVPIHRQRRHGCKGNPGPSAPPASGRLRDGLLHQQRAHAQTNRAGHEAGAQPHVDAPPQAGAQLQADKE